MPSKKSNHQANEKGYAAAAACLAQKLSTPSAAMLPPRRAWEEPLRTRCDRDYSFIRPRISGGATGLLWYSTYQRIEYQRFLQNRFLARPAPRMGTSWRICKQLFRALLIVSCIIPPLRHLCRLLAPRLIGEPQDRRLDFFGTFSLLILTSRLIGEPQDSGLDFFGCFFQDGPVYVKYHVPKRTAWITDAWSTAIMFCPYILQRLRKHIGSHIFPKPRMNPAETIAAFGSSSTGRGRFILDSGASSHFVGDAGMLQDIIYFPRDQRQRVSLADGFCLPIVGIGTLLFNGLSECGTYTRSYRVPNVRYVSGLAMNVISVGQLDKEHGFCSAFHSEKCEIIKAGGTVIGEAALVNHLYEVIYLHVPRGPEV